MHKSGPQTKLCKRGTRKLLPELWSGLRSLQNSAELQNSDYPLSLGFRWLVSRLPKQDFNPQHSQDASFSILVAASCPSWPQGHPHGWRDQDCSACPAATITSQALVLGKKVSFKKLCQTGSLLNRLSVWPKNSSWKTHQIWRKMNHLLSILETLLYFTSPENRSPFATPYPISSTRGGNWQVVNAVLK